MSGSCVLICITVSKLSTECSINWDRLAADLSKKCHNGGNGDAWFAEISVDYRIKHAPVPVSHVVEHQQVLISA